MDTNNNTITPPVSLLHQTKAKLIETLSNKLNHRTDDPKNQTFWTVNSRLTPKKNTSYRGFEQ